MGTSAIVIPRTYRAYKWSTGQVRPFPQPPGLWLKAGHFLPAWKPAQVCYPLPDALTLSTDRHHFAYYDGTNSIEYRVPLTALFGCAPFVPVVISGPPGFSVGIFTTQQGGRYIAAYWTPTATYSGTAWVRLYGPDGSFLDFIWTLATSSSTTNFIFVDAVNGSPSVANGGTGTGIISAPFKTMNDWYAGNTGGTGSNTVADSTYAGRCVYYRAGTYSMGSMYSAGNQVTIGSSKPVAHLAYPNESVIFDPQTPNVSWLIPSGFFVHGATLAGAPTTTTATGAIFWGSGGDDRITVFENIFQTPGIVAHESSNASLIYFSDGHPSIARNTSIIGNIIQGTNGYELLLAYYTQFGVVEGNDISNVNGNSANVAQAIYLKFGFNDSWTVRGNGGYTGNTKTFLEMDNYNSTTNIEITYNNYGSSGTGIEFGPNPGGMGTNSIRMARNTWRVSNHLVNYSPVTNLEVNSDVLEFTDSSANANGLLVQNGATLTNATFSNTALVALNGDFTDAFGNLLSSESAYLGILGYQIQ